MSDYLDAQIKRWQNIDCTRISCEDCPEKDFCLLATSLMAKGTDRPAVRGMDYYLKKPVDK